MSRTFRFPSWRDSLYKFSPQDAFICAQLEFALSIERERERYKETVSGDCEEIKVFRVAIIAHL